MSRAKIKPLPPGVEGFRVGPRTDARRDAEDRYWDQRRDPEGRAAWSAGVVPDGVEGYSPSTRVRPAG